MSSKIFLSLAAENDLDEIITYLAKENSKAAHDFLDSFSVAIEKLSNYPDIGHLREDLTDKPVKFWTFKWHYLIVYKPNSPLEIVRILSGFRDIINLLN